MTRLLRAGFALLALSLFTVPAFASGPMVGMHWVTERVLWRTSTTSSTDKNFSPSAGSIDSFYFSKVGKGVLAGAASGLADTTAPVNTGGWLYPVGTTAAGDTTAQFRIMFVDHGTTGSIDSLYVIPQVSASGTVWEFPNLIQNAAASGSPFAAASILTEAVPIKLLGNKTGTILFHAALSGRTSCDINSLGTWPLIRFIVLNDISAANTVIHSYECFISHYSNDTSANE